MQHFAPEVLMNVRLLTGATVLFCAGLLNAQSDQKPAADAATAEAQRQGQVALAPHATQSPTQTVQQAVAFERYKELAAERQARKDAGGSAEAATASSETRT